MFCETSSRLFQDKLLSNRSRLLRIHYLSMYITFLQTMVTLPSAGLYAVTVSAYDVAGNHRTARRFVIFDDNSVVSLQGTRTFKADSDGSCTWKTYPSHPLITNADPNANCNWITKQSPVIDLAWRERYQYHYKL